MHSGTYITYDLLVKKIVISLSNKWLKMLQFNKRYV